jgi:hypothetical protein
LTAAADLTDEILGHRLSVLLSRCGSVHVDARDLPVMVIVQTEHGVRHFAGGTVSHALAAALHGTTPRVAVEDAA